jgi:tRNA pseudouridine38-40 synthase
VKSEARLAVKLAYDGAGFMGFQRQPKGRTVEGELLRALVRIGAVESASGCPLRGSSRTDRGVSALGNVVSFRTTFSRGAVCSALNSEMEDVWAYSAVAVPEDFNPRFARQRWYRYSLPRRGQDLRLMRDLSRRFVGEHDFSEYSRRDARDPVRRIDSIDVTESGDFVLLDFRAESFLWNMVRRITWALDQGSSGGIPPDAVGPGTGPSRRSGLAPAELLVLMDVDLGLEFPLERRAADSASKELNDKMLLRTARSVFCRDLLGVLGLRDDL